ncbi:protein of unknown function [Streptomyces murinus]
MSSPIAHPPLWPSRTRLHAQHFASYRSPLTTTAGARRSKKTTRSDQLGPVVIGSGRT